MKTFFLSIAVAVFSVFCLTGCSQEGGFDNIRVDGDMVTVFETGSGPSHLRGRTSTGISF